MLRAMPEAFTGIGERWAADERRRGARWFAVACACLPVIDVIDAYSVIEALAGGLTTGSVAVPLRAWGLLAWTALAACGAGWAIGSATPRGRGRLFVICAAMHAGYALASGLRIGVAIAALCFVIAGVTLRGAGRGA